MNYLWFRISLCGLFLLAGACDSDNEPLDIPVPQVPQRPRQDIIEDKYIEIISTKCPGNFANDLVDEINQIRYHRYSTNFLEQKTDLDTYSLNSAIFYAQQEIADGQGFTPLSASPYPYKEFVFRHSVPEANLSVNYRDNLKELVPAEEIVNFWAYRANGRSANDQYRLFGSEPVDADLEKWDYFTQMIWRNTSQIGVACVTSKRTITPDTNLGIEDSVRENATKYVFNVVVNFNPPGNKDCEYRINVMPMKNTTIGPELDLIQLAKDNNLTLTHECSVKKNFYRNMTSCPPEFVNELLNGFNVKRSARTIPKLELDTELAAYSQRYANWLIRKPHEVFGNEPNNQHGGDIVWQLSKEGHFEVQLVDIRHILKNVTRDEINFENAGLFGKEPNPEQKKTYSDLTRIIWRNTQRMGVGCGLDWPLGQNRTRAIIVINFNKGGNLNGLYSKNVKKPDSDKAENNEIATNNYDDLNPDDILSAHMDIANRTNADLASNDVDDEDDVDDEEEKPEDVE